MDEDYEIRLFQSGDLPRMHEIRNAAFAPVFKSFRDIVGAEIAPIALASAEEEQGQFLDTICAADSGHEVYVVENDAGIVAFVSLVINQNSKMGEVDLNAVDPEHQGHGIATTMYSFALDRMREEGMIVAIVGTGGDPSHAPARRAYEKTGFGPRIPSHWYYTRL